MPEAVKGAASRLDLQAEVEYITDTEKIMAYGIMRLPALAVDGKVPKAAEAEKTSRG